MSNGRRHRRRLNRPDLDRVAVTIARLEGCTCSPDADVAELMPLIYRATVRHDGWCPLMLAKNAGWN